MSRIVLGYGMCHGYRITEIPREMLEELATRYPLDIQDGSSPEYQDLFITIAVHAELQRRSKGGQQDQHVPTLRELAEAIVTKGYKQASKQYHPDGRGHHEAQVRLTQARDELRGLCRNLPDGMEHDAIIIPAPGKRDASTEISDDDVPF